MQEEPGKNVPFRAHPTVPTIPPLHRTLDLQAACCNGTCLWPPAIPRQIPSVHLHLRILGSFFHMISRYSNETLT